MYLYYTFNSKLALFLNFMCVYFFSLVRFKVSLGQKSKRTCFNLAVYSTGLCTSIPLTQPLFFRGIFCDAPSKGSVISHDFVHTTILVHVIQGKLELSSLLFFSFTLSWEETLW